MKVAIGCGVLAVVVVVGIVLASIAGGMFLRRKAQEWSGDIEGQAEAGAIIDRLEAEHPFSSPADGVVNPARAERFFAVTDLAWKQIEPKWDELEERGREIGDRGGEASVGDVIAGVRGLTQARSAIAKALDEHEMPVSEYVWVGFALTRAYRALDGLGQGQRGIDREVPQANLDLAARYRDELLEISGGGPTPGKSSVLGLAVTLDR
ncbi:MAG: hypothetical protein P8Y29_07750 [Gemmatimonadota bacterium]